MRQSFLDIWGLGSRSLPKSVGHLLLRPGYLINDYISGKRQVSFPPVKMLFFVSVIIVVLVYYLLPLLFGNALDVYGGTTGAFMGFDDWNRGHLAWTQFITAILFILPTWIMFRYSPRNTRHTLPKGFFIQVFLCVLNLIVSYVLLLPFMLLGYEIYYFVSTVVVLLYYVIVNKQLFGYGVWGTLWRTLVIDISVIFMIQTVLYLVFEVDFGQMDPASFSSSNGRFFYAGQSFAWGLIVLGIGWLINLIATYVSRRIKK